MEQRAIIISVILFFVLVGVILFVYFRYERPIQEENQIYLIDLSIFAKDGDKLIRTNYSVYANGFYLGSGLTNEYGAVLQKVPYNSSITLVNSNLPGQTYYKHIENLVTDKNETTRVNLDLVNVGNLTIISNISNYKINTTVFTEGYFKQPAICLYWSIHVIFAEILNMTQISPIENNTKCYQGNTLDNSNFNFIINYQVFGTLNEEDYIDIKFFDFDEIYTLRQTKLININNNV